MNIINLVTIVLACGVALVGAIWGIVMVLTDFKRALDSGKILFVTAAIVIISPYLTYAVADIMRLIRDDFGLEQIGSADAWIGFSGSIIGGAITMLALYITLRHERAIKKQEHINTIKPGVFCNILNYDAESNEIMLRTYINDYDFIRCKLHNYSTNVANDVKIVDEYSMVQAESDSFEKVDDLQAEYGISIYTVSMSENTFLAPGEDYLWRTNFGVERSIDGKYRWDGSEFLFKHIVVFEYSDGERQNKYRSQFTYTININVDVDNCLHFFLDSVSNIAISTEEGNVKQGKSL